MTWVDEWIVEDDRRRESRHRELLAMARCRAAMERMVLRLRDAGRPTKAEARELISMLGRWT